MKSIILTAALTLLAVSGALNWALMTGRLGASHMVFAKIYDSEESYRLASKQ